MSVIAVMAIIATIGFYGMRGTDDSQKVAEAKRQLLADLRGVQNNALAGETGGQTRWVTFTQNSYTIRSVDNYSHKFEQDTTTTLPDGVTLDAQPALPNPFTVCFANPNAVEITCPPEGLPHDIHFTFPYSSGGTLNITLHGRSGPVENIYIQPDSNDVRVVRIYD